MCLESLVAIMAMIAACTLDPGVYLSMNLKAPGADPAAIAAATVAQVNAFGPVFARHRRANAHPRRHSRTRTPSSAAPAAPPPSPSAWPISSPAPIGEPSLGLWYHFAIMFEALFILTTLDAGTRVGRYLLQDALGHLWPPLGDTRSLWAKLLASALIVAAWGYFLIAGVHDPDGGIKALWPIFGIANQLLAAIALCLATTILLKIQLQQPEKARPGIILVTLLPLCVLLAITTTAGIQKIAHSNPKIGFLAGAAAIEAKIPGLEAKYHEARKLTPGWGDPTIPVLKDAIAHAPEVASAEKTLRTARAQAANLRLDAIVTGAFLALVAALVAISLREWTLLLSRQKPARLHETSPIYLPPGALEPEPSPLSALGAIGLSLALLKEITGEAALDRAQTAAAQTTATCPTPRPPPSAPAKTPTSPPPPTASPASTAAAEGRGKV